MGHGRQVWAKIVKFNVYRPSSFAALAVTLQVIMTLILLLALKVRVIIAG